jgi:anti-sigma factor RsiW
MSREAIGPLARPQPVAAEHIRSPMGTHLVDVVTPERRTGKPRFTARIGEASAPAESLSKAADAI